MLKILVAGQIEALPENLQTNPEFYKSHWMFSENVSRALEIFDLHDPEIILLNINFDNGQGIDLIQCLRQYCSNNQSLSPEIWVSSHHQLDVEIIDYLYEQGVTRIFTAPNENQHQLMTAGQFLVSSYA